MSVLIAAVLVYGLIAIAILSEPSTPGENHSGPSGASASGLS